MEACRPSPIRAGSRPSPKVVGFLQTRGLNRSWRRRKVRHSIQNIKVVDNGVLHATCVCPPRGACSIASRRPALPCWPGRPVQPSMQLLDAKVFPARFVRPMPDWRWRTAMVKIFCPCPIRSGSRLSQKSEFSRRPAASAGDERVPPFVPKYQARRHCNGVSPFQVCLSTHHHEHCQQFFC